MQYDLKTYFPGLSTKALNLLKENGTVVFVKAGNEILREGQYVKVIPFVLSGALSVFSRFNDRDLLLYYITPGQSCIMSFSSGLNNSPSRVIALAEQDSEALLLPVSSLNKWLVEYPELNSVFFQEYGKRYQELLDTINQLIFSKLDERIIQHLKQRTTVTGLNRIKITHRQLATELGTTREVISRLIKILEREGKLHQDTEGIQVL